MELAGIASQSTFILFNCSAKVLFLLTLLRSTIRYTFGFIMLLDRKEAIKFKYNFNKEIK